MARIDIPLDGVKDPNDENDSGDAEQMNSKSSGRSSVNLSNVMKDPKGATAKAVASKAVQAAGDKLPEGSQKTIEKGVKTAQTIAAAKSAIAAGSSALSSAGSFIAAVVIDPIAWIVIIAIFVIVSMVLGIVAGVQLFGQNENANGCSGIGGDSALLPTSASNTDGTVDQMANRDAIANWLLTTNFEFLGNKPMTMNQAAAFIGNAYQESKFNPAISQSSGSSSNMTNEQLAALGTSGGKAAGIFQWDVAGRLALANFAKQQGKNWYDMGLQLEYLKALLDGKNTEVGVNYGQRLLAGGFNDTNKTVDELTGIVNEYFEISGDRPSICAKNGTCDRNQARIDAAKEFLSSYKGGSGLQSGGSCLLGTNAGSVNTSDAAQLAISIAWPTREQSLVSGSVSGKEKAKPEYIAAKQQAMQQYGFDSYLNGDLYASCDRFVATVIKLTMDPDIPWGPTSTQQQYLESSPKWQRYETKAEAQPGDIWVTRSNGHIVMYVGAVNGVDSIAHASYSPSGRGRVGAVVPSTYISDSLVDKGGRPYYGYHFVG